MLKTYLKSVPQMTDDVNRIKKEVIGAGPSVNGNPSFRGGPYGHGNKKQLATNLNPATQKIEDQEQEEHNKNVKSQNWIDKKFPDPNEVVYTSERNESDAFAPAPHLPGNRRENSIEAPEIHVPLEDPRETDKYLIDMIEEVLEEVGGLYPYSFKSTMPDLNPNNNEEEEGHFTLDPAKKSPGAGMGQVLAPKDFIPGEAPQQSKFEDSDLDGIPNHLDPNTEPELKREIDKMDEARHSKRYGPKTPSDAQILKKFKETKGAMLSLLEIILLSDHDYALDDLKLLFGELTRIEKLVFNLDEKLDPDTHSFKDYIKDFQKSDAPQFKGKSDEKRKQMALAAYYNDEKNEGFNIENLTEKVLKKLLENNDEQ
jgi:hypothetical protein